MSKCAVIIPALNPTESLIEYVKTLLASDIPQVIIVDDGSKEELKDIFATLSKLSRCIVLTHESNKGKGRALKTAFQYFLKHHSNLDGVITADADGQHSTSDVLKLAAELGSLQNGIILGVRDFRQNDVPVRSIIGNRITSFIFSVFYGDWLEDTQTGLRGIPRKELAKIIDLKGERYEYEINMLIYAKKMNLKVREIPIQTLYFNNNEGSHYNSVIDSLRVFSKLLSGLLKYSFTTLASGIIDIVCFFLLSSVILTKVPIGLRVFMATLGARVISSSSNFYMNRKLVFQSQNNLKQAIIRYYILFFGLIAASYTLVLSASLVLDVNIILAKICIDALLGIISYQIQLHWVFEKPEKNSNKQIAGE